MVVLRSLHRLVQQKHIKESGLELDSCPFCDFSICIENPDEKLFVCQNDDCAVVSCRNCKREEHLPKSCEGMPQTARIVAQSPDTALTALHSLVRFVICAEMAKDNKLDFRVRASLVESIPVSATTPADPLSAARLLSVAQHLVEEEMTKALIRICPNPTCKKPAVKEAGCNKMSCNVWYATSAPILLRRPSD